MPGDFRIGCVRRGGSVGSGCGDEAGEVGRGEDDGEEVVGFEVDAEEGPAMGTGTGTDEARACPEEFQLVIT